MNSTIAVIKPDAIDNKYTGKIIEIIQKSNFEISEMKYIRFASTCFVADFYKCHKDKDFYVKLVNGMVGKPWIIMRLKHKGDAINIWRKTMKTIRKKYSSHNPWENAVHGSDSVDSFLYEYLLCFGGKQ